MNPSGGITTHLRVAFCDFWPAFNPTDNYFVRLLSQCWRIEHSAIPQLVICSHWSGNHQRFTCPKVFYTGEALSPNLAIYDYALSFDLAESTRQHRLPLYALLLRSPHQLVKSEAYDPEAILSSKRHFCAFLSRTPGRGNGSPCSRSFTIQTNRLRRSGAEQSGVPCADG